MNLLKNPFIQILILAITTVLFFVAIYYNYHNLVSVLCIVITIVWGIYRYKKALEIVKEKQNNMLVKKYKRLVILDNLLVTGIIIIIPIHSLLANSGLSYEIKKNISKLYILVLLAYIIINLYYLSKRKSLFKKIYEQLGIDPNFERLEF
ncbi:hypothetical protein [Gemelliphila palaticanis]|uniref:Uncharacterized protein n=1 Tax=Gemelliphila palaticanis TaxID=81950 RepID=A0ABX2SZ33_9BACL|nr:hypothetical protein [Gemella palaticanis]MBF0715701.1 hypothetical protein [Gemella palaticanis]NYS47631.1 hypothetical protein [Gemella palaticanis]